MAIEGDYQVKKDDVRIPDSLRIKYHKAGKPTNRDRQIKEYERKEALRRYKLRVARVTHRLLNAQLSIALGETNLYVTKTVGKGDKQRKTTEIVNDPEVVIAFLNGELKDNSKEEYYYIATKSPDLRAIDSILDRTYGKPKQEIDITSGDETIKAMPVSDMVLIGFQQYMLESTKDPIAEGKVIDAESQDIK